MRAPPPPCPPPMLPSLLLETLCRQILNVTSDCEKAYINVKALEKFGLNTHKSWRVCGTLLTVFVQPCIYVPPPTPQILCIRKTKLQHALCDLLLSQNFMFF